MTILANAAHAQQQLQHFLLQGPAQVQSGLHKGGVAGGLSANGEPSYVYGEITGYYLHWLASLAGDHALRAAKAEAAQGWLLQSLSQQPWPPTRVYLTAQASDWRNQVLFAFDLAMVAGGLARAAAHRLLTLDAALIARLQELLLLMLHTPELKPWVAPAQAGDLPQRWSTLGGPFTAKTCSRILQLHKQTPLDASLVRHCEQQLQHYHQLAPAFPPELLHPTLYALEGLLLAPAPRHNAIAQVLEQLLALQTNEGYLPEAWEPNGVVRNDVASQALRMALMLEAHLQDRTRFTPAIKKIAAMLSAQVRSDGSIGFNSDKDSPANIWCAMFAEQALRLYVAREQQQALPFAEDDIV